MLILILVFFIFLQLVHLEFMGLFVQDDQVIQNIHLLGRCDQQHKMISYEIGMGFILLLIFLLVGSLNLTDIVLAQKYVWFCVPLLPATIV